MFFKAVFIHWLNDEDPEELPKMSPQDYIFSIEADSKEEVLKIAHKHERLEVSVFEEIGSLQSLMQISEEEARSLTPIAIYQDYLPG